jgi:ATP-dependent DNA helicase PIF1
MKKLQTEERLFVMTEHTSKQAPKMMNNYEIQFLKSNTNCEKKLKLKIGAQVMCIVNMLDETGVICNGSKGIVTNFSENGFPVVKYLCGLELEMKPHQWKSEIRKSIYIEQIPLMLAWAVTIHKSQGASIELAEIDVGNDIFACGQTYVALSRVTDLKGLYLIGFDYRKIAVSKKVKKFYKSLREKDKPVVKLNKFSGATRKD